MRPLTEAEVVAIADSFSGKWRLRDKALFLLGIGCGFRISELLALTMGDIAVAISSVAEAQITVKKRFMKGKVRGRSVWVPEYARDALREWAASRTTFPYEPVFRSNNPSRRLYPVGRIQAWRIIGQAMRRAGVQDVGLGTHSMRRTFAQTVYALSGKNILLTQKALGHSSISITAVYLANVDEELKALLLARKLKE